MGDLFVLVNCCQMFIYSLSVIIVYNLNQIVKLFNFILLDPIKLMTKY